MSLALGGVTRGSSDRDAEDTEAAARGGRFFDVLRDGRGERIAHGDLVTDAGCDDELRGLDELFQVFGRVGAEFELAGIEVPEERGWVSDLNTMTGFCRTVCFGHACVLWICLDLPQARLDRDCSNVIVRQLHADRRSCSRTAECLRCCGVLAADAPGREPPAAGIRANASLAEVVLRGGFLAVDLDLYAVVRLVVGRPLRFLDEFLVALRVIQGHVERFGRGAIPRCGSFVFVVAPLEQGQRFGAPGSGSHVVAYRCQYAFLNWSMISSSPWVIPITDGFSDTQTLRLQRVTLRAIDLALEVFDFGLDLVFAAQSCGVELAVAVFKPSSKVFGSQAQVHIILPVVFSGLLLPNGVGMCSC